ncbi:sugar transporter [Cognatishimia sp. WU-CL00825]|uniref:capsule biosynthesis protein n=1 Tax=Cognatishimia sp. WU-CL00825 TaxID=3127658 RepID=UPI003104938A
MVILSFLCFVLLPAALTAWYLWTRAADQYASRVGFSVRTEEAGSAIESIVGIAQLSGSSSSDTDILYEYLQSQELVQEVDDALDLQTIWAKADPDIDPIFAYDPTGTIEDLLRHWQRKVKVYYDSGTGLIDIRVLTFDPEDSRVINELIYEKSSLMINKLSAIAREDAVSYARDELAQAEDRLKAARLALLSFRNRTQIIDPTIQTQTQSGLIGALETQLADAQINRALLQETTQAGDPRVVEVERRIRVIQDQIAKERAKLGLSNAQADTSVATMVGEFEALSVELEFAQQAYTATRVAFDTARNDARRQSRYLAAHVAPTKAEKAEYPEREILFVLITLFLFLGWAVSVLMAYALRDRR